MYIFSSRVQSDPAFFAQSWKESSKAEEKNGKDEEKACKAAKKEGQ